MSTPENQLAQIATTPPATPEPATPSESPAAIDQRPDPEKLKAEIEELEQKRKKAEEDSIYWRKQKAEARAEYFRGGQQPPQQPQAPTGIGAEPKPGDFDNYDAYVGALTDYRVKKARAEWEMDQQRRNFHQAQQQKTEELHTKLQDGYKKYPDFEEVVFDRTAVHITPMVVGILAECDSPADVAYYLTKNRVEGVAISKMTPLRAAREIARIEAKLAAGPSPPINQPQRISNAPPPITPVGSGPSGTTKDPEKMTPKEFAAWRESQGAKRF